MISDQMKTTIGKFVNSTAADDLFKNINSQLTAQVNLSFIRVIFHYFNIINT